MLYTETGTRFGLQQGASFYAGMIPGDISFERAEGTLASGVTLEGFEIRDRHGRALVRSEHVRLGVDVGAALGRTIDVGTIEVRNAEVAVDGAFGDLAPEGPSDPTPPRDTLGPDLPFELVGQLELRNIELHDATQTLTRVHVLDADVWAEGTKATLAVDAGAAVLVAGGATGGGLGVKGYRAMYRYAMRRGQRALDGLLGAVASRAEYSQ